MRRMFSENQIGEVALKQLADKDLKVKTIEQSEANWNINDAFDVINVPAGLVYTKKYARFEAINGVLFIVHCYTISNPTENSLNYNTLTSITLPDEIAEKIYDFDGKSAKESNSANISSDYAMYGAGTELYNTRIFTIENASEPNVIRYRGVNSTAIPADSTMLFCFRTFLTLL